MPHHIQPITRAEFVRLTRRFVGMPVSFAWRGYGSAVFLELGELHERVEDGRAGRHPKGEGTAMIQWSWRVEGPRSVRFGSWSGDRKLDLAIPRLAARVVSEIEVWGRWPEIAIGLSGGLRLVSFTTVEAQPRWAFFIGPSDWICVRRGRLMRWTWRDG